MNVSEFIVTHMDQKHATQLLNNIYEVDSDHPIVWTKEGLDDFFEKTCKKKSTLTVETHATQLLNNIYEFASDNPIVWTKEGLDDFFKNTRNKQSTSTVEGVVKVEKALNEIEKMNKADREEDKKALDEIEREMNKVNKVNKANSFLRQLTAEEEAEPYFDLAVEESTRWDTVNFLVTPNEAESKIRFKISSDSYTSQNKQYLESIANKIQYVRVTNGTTTQKVKLDSTETSNEWSIHWDKIPIENTQFIPQVHASELLYIPEDSENLQTKIRRHLMQQTWEDNETKKKAITILLQLPLFFKRAQEYEQSVYFE